MDRTVHRSFCAVLILSVFLLILAYAIPQNVIFNPNSEIKTILLEPVITAELDGGVTEMVFDVSDRPLGSDMLFFKALHVELFIYSDGELLYSLERGSMPWMSTTGCVYDTVYLSEDMTQVSVTVRNLYPGISTNHAEFYTANGTTLAVELAGESLIQSMISIIDILLGLVMIAFWFLYRNSDDSKYILSYLGIFSVAVGVWSLSETIIVVLIISDAAASSFTAYISLMLFVVPFVQFTKYYFGYFERVADYLSVAAIVVQVVLTFMHITGMLGFKQMISAIHLLMLLGMVLYVVSFIRFVHKGTQKRKIMVNFVAMLILALACAIDFSLYFSGSLNSTFAGRLGLMLYLLILGMETAVQLVRDAQSAREAEIYKDLAYRDNLTGLYNRNAYIDWMKKVENPENLSIINFDLNDLKKCNDTYGHVNGDKYISDSAEMIYKIFNEVGKCFRIGGDEFVVVIENGLSENMVKRRLNELENMQREYNASSDIVKMHMAYGYAKFDPSKDRSVEALGTRADARMYAHKKLLKSAHDDDVAI